MTHSMNTIPPTIADADQAAWFTEYVLRAWSSGIGCAGVRTDMDVRVADQYSATGNDADLGKQIVKVSVTITVPISAQANAVSEHRWGIPLYDVWQQTDVPPTLAIGKAVASMIQVMQEKLIEKLTMLDESIQIVQDLGGMN